jgi:DNA-binding NarL/FixJ family response regulator
MSPLPRSTSADKGRSAALHIRVVLADDHRLMREGLQALLGRESDIAVIGTAADGLDAVRMARDTQPDVLVTDLNMPGLNGLEAIRRIHAEHPAIKLLCLSMHDDSRMVMSVLRAGASGYLLKDNSSDELSLAIRKVVAQHVYLDPELVTTVVEAMRGQGSPGAQSAEPERPALTPRERELVQLLSEGFSTQSIADRLHVSVKTVATHRENVMQKLHLDSVAALTRYALREGLSSLDTPCGAPPRTRRRGAT